MQMQPDLKITNWPKLFSLVLGVITLSVSMSTPVLAQEQVLDQKKPKPAPPLSLAVSPPTSYLYVKPSEKIKHTLTLKNTGIQTLKINMQLTDFKPDGKTGQPLLSSGTIFDKAVNPNLEFGDPFQLKPQDNRTVTLQLDAAKLAPQQEYPLSILFHAESIKDQTNQTTYSHVAGTVVSNLIIFISESQENQGEIVLDQFKAPRIIDSFQPILFSLTAKNVGLNAMPIQGRAFVKNFLGQTINEFVFYPDQILADSTRQVRGTEFHVDLFDQDQKLVPEKISDLSTQFKHKAPLLLGPYQIELQLAQSTKTVHVIAFPFSFIVASLVGFLIFTGYKQLKEIF